MTGWKVMTDSSDEKLLEEIAQTFEVYASDSEAFAARGWQKRKNTIRAKVWREAAEDLRLIRVVKGDAT